MNDLQEIGAMLAYRRPAGSKTERRFIKRFLSPLEMQQDAHGNLYKRIGNSPVLWSCHTDTVHRTGGQQYLKFEDGIYTAVSKDSNCLGADDTAGVWLMKQMIEAKVPGLYVFHRGEEIGGVGSGYIERNFKDELKKHTFAIAFDRYGTNSIITHQGGLRCCSEDFATSLSKQLGMGHKADSGGSFTDTANYVDHIPECTNLSVGYYDQHCKKESLDTTYLCQLRDSLLEFDHKNLTEKRKAGEIEYDFDFSAYGVGNYHSIWDDADQDPVPFVRSRDHRDLVEIIKDNPREIADFLEEYGVSADEIAEVVWRRGGWVRGMKDFKH